MSDRQPRAYEVTIREITQKKVVVAAYSEEDARRRALRMSQAPDRRVIKIERAESSATPARPSSYGAPGSPR